MNGSECGRMMLFNGFIIDPSQDLGVSPKPRHVPIETVHQSCVRTVARMSLGARELASADSKSYWESVTVHSSSLSL